MVSKKHLKVKCSQVIYTGYCLFLKYSSIACFFFFPWSQLSLIIIVAKSDMFFTLRWKMERFCTTVMNTVVVKIFFSLIGGRCLYFIIPSFGAAFLRFLLHSRKEGPHHHFIMSLDNLDKRGKVFADMRRLD